MNIKSTILLRVRIAFLVVVLFSFIIIGKIFYLQVIDSARWKKKAEQISLRYMKIKANRGNIFSDNGSLLATSIPFYKLAMDPKVPHDTVFNKGIDSLSWLLSRFFGDKSKDEYKRKIKNARLEKGEKYIVLNTKLLTYNEKKSIQKWPVFRAGRYKGGAIFERTEKRFHPFGSQLATRTIGYINLENKGVVGLEFSFDKQLGGHDGHALFRKLAGGSWKPIHDEKEVLPDQGYDIETTIDVNLQDVAESSLEYHLKKHNAAYGCVALMEVKTGEIKAIANLGRNLDGNYTEAYNYAVGTQGLTDPGSTFKLASLMSLFEETSLSLDDTVDCGTGEYKFKDRILRDHHEEGFGKLSVKQVFAKSSNIGVAKLMDKYFAQKPQKFIEYILSFGLGTQINFQMAGEAMPYIKKPTDKSWSGISMLWMSIGYELKLSPIHTLTFYNAVANDGEMIQPIIVKRIIKGDVTVQQYKTHVLNKNICSANTLKKVREMMESVVEEGTAKNIYTPNYRIAGKTGTAQIIKNGVYTKNYYTSFCGFFPADKPKYSCIVVISEPQGFLQMGSDVSAPVFKEVADKIYALDPEMHKELETPEQPKMYDFPVVRAGYAEDLRFICNEYKISNHTLGNEEWVSARVANNAIIWRDRKFIQNLMPDVTGFTLKDALYVLENNGLMVKYNGYGRVLTQSIPPGLKINKNNIVHLKLG